jgi:hypothetical protein
MIWFMASHPVQQKAGGGVAAANPPSARYIAKEGVT